MESNGGTEQFMYKGGNQPAAPPVSENPPAQDFPVIEWQASEFIDHQKSASWFILLALGAVAGSVIMYLITESIFSSIVVLLALLAFGQVAHQKPRTLHYALLNQSIKVDEKSYSYDDFKSFSATQDGGLPSMSLQPIKRFMPVLTIYFPPDEGEKIFDALATHLPHEQRKDDAVDRLMQRIRF